MITEKEFRAYELVRQSCITNMFNVSEVCEYTNLPRDKVIYIMENYRILKEREGGTIS